MKKFLFLILFLAIPFGTALAQTGGLKGKIRTAGGDSISGATITVRQGGDDLKSIKSDSKGKFLLEGLKPGKYNVVFSKNGFSSGLMYDVEVVAKSVRDLGDRLILIVDQGTQVIINGSAYNQEGFALYGAKVTIHRVLSDGSTKKAGSGYTSRSGEFTFRFAEGLATFRVTVSAKGNETSKDIEVEEAAIYRLALTLDLGQK